MGKEGGHSSDGLFEFIAKVAPCLLSSRDAFALSGESPSRRIVFSIELLAVKSHVHF